MRAHARGLMGSLTNPQTSLVCRLFLLGRYQTVGSVQVHTFATVVSKASVQSRVIHTPKM